MKIIFMGTPDFSVGTLDALVRAGHEITLVVSQPDKPKGRGHELAPTAVKTAALRHGLKVFQPKKLRDPETVKVLEDTPADVIVVIAYGQIVPPAVLHMKKYGCINVHGSLLPKYRGAAPIQWAIIEGEAVTGVTTMQMDEGLDTGDMILKKEVPVSEDETGESLHDKLAAAGAELCVETLKAVEDGTAVFEKQGESPTPYAKMLTKELGNIDWTWPAERIGRLIRGLNPWPSAYTHWNGKVMKIWRAKAEESGVGEMPPGTICRVGKNDLCVQTGDGILRVYEVQIPGKKRMDTGAFLRGYSVEPGTLLTEE